MTRPTGWETSLSHADFMAEIRRMSSGTYKPRRSWDGGQEGRIDRSEGAGRVMAGRGGRVGRRPHEREPDPPPFAPSTPEMQRSVTRATRQIETPRITVNSIRDAVR